MVRNYRKIRQCLEFVGKLVIEGLSDALLIEVRTYEDRIMPKIILLDRNVISLIKDINSGKAITDSNKLCMVDRLRKLDSSKNKISPIFSIIEGQKGRLESLQEKEETAEIETDELRKFFKNAHVDKYPTDNVGDLYAALNIDSSYVNTEKAMKSFLSKASDILKNPVSQSTRV